MKTLWFQFKREQYEDAWICWTCNVRYLAGVPWLCYCPGNGDHFHMCLDCAIEHHTAEVLENDLV